MDGPRGRGCFKMEIGRMEYTYNTPLPFDRRSVFIVRPLQMGNGEWGHIGSPENAPWDL